MSQQENYANDLDGAKCLEFIRLAANSVGQTIQSRRQNKLSISKYQSVRRELIELQKVLLTYIKHHNDNL